MGDLKKTIMLCVTNDLVFDQRMNRICSSLAGAGYRTILVGRELPDSPPLPEKRFEQVRLKCKFHKGKLFYIEYNYLLYKYLLNSSADALCAIDLDTIVPVYLVSQKKGIPRMYDAHEYFTEMIEVKRRPLIHFIWKTVEKWVVPKFPFGYTVATGIQKEFKTLYQVDYALVRNVPFYVPPVSKDTPAPTAVMQIMKAFDRQCPAPAPFILYQGAINEGRALIPLLEAMDKIPARLLLAGTGNMEEKVKAYIEAKGLQTKVYMCGNVPPSELRYLTALCYCGITIFDATSKNQYYSLGNKFFDYIMAHKPQVCVNYPEYKAILKDHPVAVPMEDTRPETIALALNKLLEDPVLYNILKIACADASRQLNWEKEEKVMLDEWKKCFEQNV